MIAADPAILQLELEQRLVEALDRFHQGCESEDDLHIINYHTGLTNYRPRHENH